jgi:propanol-preferring alcohol dehydrogenase
MDWEAGALPYELPFTLGHETAGRVAELGAGVTAPEVGAGVAVYGAWGCGRCRECRRSRETLCERSGGLGATGGGLGQDGGMAEYVLVPDARVLVELGDLDPITAAPLSDAGLTPYHAIKRSLPLLVPGSTAVVIGAGGLGHLAIQILRALSPAHVIAVDLSADKRRLARDVGAHETADSALDCRADLVLDFVGTDTTMALAASVVRRGGDVAIIGHGGGRLDYAFGTLPADATLSMPYWGTILELMEVLALARAGVITPHVETFPLERAADAYERLRDGTLSGRAVICPRADPGRREHSDGERAS